MNRLHRTRSVLLVLPLVLIACSDEPTAPEEELVGGLQLSVVEPQTVSQAEIDALGAAFDRVDRYTVTIVDALTEELVADTAISIPEGSTIHDLNIAVPEDAFGRTVTITLIAYDGELELYRSIETTTLSEDPAAAFDIQVEIRYTGPGIRGVVRAEGQPVSGGTVNLFVGQSIVDAVETEDDGTFLFLDVGTGAYSVRPNSVNGLNVCPGSRDLMLSTATDAIIANFDMEDGCSVDVLVLSGGDFDDTQAAAALLAQGGDLDVSTFFHVNRLPGVDYLNQFDVVLVFMNGLFDESAALGNQIAQFVAHGGSVVTASFYYQGRSDAGRRSVGWGALEQLDPFAALVDPSTGEGGATYQAVALQDGTRDLDHPITEFVSSLTSASFSSGVRAKPDTQVLAYWDDGAPLVGYRIGPAGQRLVGVSLFPVEDPSITGSYLLLWLNAVRWAAYAPTAD